MTTENPTVLYKYKDLTRDGIKHVEDMLRDNQLWFSSPTDFNDPFDSRPVYDPWNSRKDVVWGMTGFLARRGASLADALAQAEQNIPQRPDDLKRWHRRQIEKRSRQIANTGILCLTPLPANQLMWTHYANSHKGICIKLRVPDECEESQIDFIANAQPVEYADRCPAVNLVRDEAVDIVRKTFLTKASPYGYEGELRIVRYDDGPGLKPIPVGIIGSVILGVQIKQTDRDRVIKACTEYDGEVDIEQAILDPQTYGLKFELVRTV